MFGVFRAWGGKEDPICQRIAPLYEPIVQQHGKYACVDQGLATVFFYLPPEMPDAKCIFKKRLAPLRRLALANKWRSLFFPVDQAVYESGRHQCGLIAS
jgi:hypothetical protein